MKVECYEFEEFGGAVAHEERKGKTHWPNQLTLRLSKYHAWDMLEQLQRQLRNIEGMDGTDENDVVVHMCGKLDHIETGDI